MSSWIRDEMYTWRKVTSPLHSLWENACREVKVEGRVKR